MSTIISVIGNALRVPILCKVIPDNTGLRYVGNVLIGRQRLPTEAIGITTITFSGVAAGCEIRVFLLNGTEIAGIESCAANQALSWDVYATGSSNNNVRILIVNIAYEIIDLLYTSSIGNASIPIEMREDPWFKDPV